MLNINQMGWDPRTLGEIDHQKVLAPYIRLSSYTTGENGDVVYVYDLRLTQPNVTYLKPDVLHSLEHFFLAGFRKHLKEKFINVSPMGCQTGFYLILINKGNADEIFLTFETILQEILKMDEVSYADIQSCGQYLYHDLIAAKDIVKKFLHKKSSWRVVF
ncbi:MAG: S-ribosylhomocysteine lyase [Alphaproteobacteria bacterium]